MKHHALLLPSLSSSSPSIRYKPEVTALLDLILFRFTILHNQPTPGMRMQNLQYINGGR